jgi:Ni/Co efflux regulator RcnB
MNKHIVLMAAALSASALHAETEPSALWATPGAVSYHLTHRERNHNETHYGFGVEYQHSAAGAAMLGVYRNSQDRWSRYALYQWTPVAVSKYLRVGAQAGVVDGYRNKGISPVVIPTASIETRRHGLNVSFIPANDAANNAAAITLQYKARF